MTPVAAAATTAAAAVAAAAVVSKAEVLPQQSAQKVDLSDNEDSDVSANQGDIQPVGHDYVEEVGKKWGENNLELRDIQSKMGHMKAAILFSVQLLAVKSSFF